MDLITELPLSVILLAGTVMLFAGFVHGTLGLGFPMVATPLLALFLDVRTAILITLLPTAVVNVASILKGGEWRESTRDYWPLALWSVAGGVVGAAVIASNDPAPFQLLLALLIFLFLGSHAVGAGGLPWLSGDARVVMPIVGLVGGFAAGTTNVMVPILIIYSLSLSLSKNTTVQVFNLCFLAGKLAQMAVFGWNGLISIGFILSTVPFALLGYGALIWGVKIRDRMPTETFRKIIRLVLLLLGMLLVWQFFSDWLG